MTKYKFECNVWIKFTQNGLTCVGRTLIIEGKPLVSIVNSVGMSGIVDFSSIENPTKVKFLEDTENDKQAWNNVKNQLFFTPAKEPIYVTNNQEDVENLKFETNGAEFESVFKLVKGDFIPYLGKIKPEC